MSDTILTGDFTVYYLGENRQKRIEYTGSGTTYTVNELYSALQDHFDELTQMDDGTPMSAQTPTAYTIGTIDAGDNDPWFIDFTSVEYLTGGALSTSGWTRTTGTDTGIVRVAYTEGGTALQASDIGETITLTGDGDTGTILDYNTTGTTKYLWIRPTSNAAANDWDGSGACTVSNSSANPSITAASNTTGDLLWANIYNTGLATLQSNTHQYIQQDGSLLTAYKDTSDWWGDGQFDILVPVKEPGASASTEIDYAKVKVLARQYSTGYAWFEVDLSAGGRNPIPLTSLSDLDNTTGFKLINASSGTGTFDVGDIIGDTDSLATATKLGIVTAVAGTAADPDIDYYPIGDPITDFTTGTVYDITGDGQATIDTVSDTNVATTAWYNGTAFPTITFGYAGAGYDLNEDGTDEDYSIVIDCNQATLAEMWEYLKYVTRRGNSSDIDAGTQTVEGQFYTGIERRFEYTYTAGTFTEGDLVYFFDASDNLVAFGTLLADDTTKDEFMIGNYKVVGTGTITKFDDNDTYAADGTYGTIQSTSIITPVQKCPFGDFAGGTFFGAEGVVLTDYITTEANSFQLKDNQGNVVQVPSKISITVSNTRVGDRILVARTDVNDNIVRDRYNSHATNNVQGDLTFDVDGTPSIGNDEPGKTTGGVLRVVAVDEQVEHRYRFASWDTDTFTLATTSATADAGGSATSLVDADGAFTTGPKAVVGDIVFNDTENTYGYVTAVTATELTLTNVGSDAPVTDWSSDAYIINGLVQTYDGSDTAWVPLLDTVEDTGTTASPGSEGTNITWAATTDDVIIRARNASGTYKMLPYAATSNVSNENFSNSIIRSPDTISSN